MTNHKAERRTAPAQSNIKLGSDRRILLNLLAIEHECTTSEIMVEAFDEWIASRGIPTVAERTAAVDALRAQKPSIPTTRPVIAQAAVEFPDGSDHR